ncbi:MAG TPA: hypothetical protein VL625_08175 [Patescibacteria group bacterium]|jgi:hypothetical protein|nr:hypothetical protein [Patescibacteria group bacterium]
MKAPKSVRVALLTAASLLVGATTVYAATATVTSSIRFLTHITITQNTAPNFGNVSSGVGDTFTLSTAGVVTDTAAGAHLEGGTTAAGDYTVVASTNQAIGIYADGYTTDGSSTAQAATCKYAAGSSVTCDGVGNQVTIATPAASATLKVGLQIVTTGGTDGVTEQPAMTLHVVYQ